MSDSKISITFKDNVEYAQKGKGTDFRGQHSFIKPMKNSSGAYFVPGLHEDANAHIRKGLEDRLGVDLSPKNEAFWGTMTVNLDPKRANVFHTSDPDQYLQALVCMSHPTVDDGSGRKPRAIYHVVDERAKAALTSANAAYMAEALTFATKADREDVMDALHALNVKVDLNKDTELLRTSLIEEVQKDPVRLVTLRKDVERYNLNIVISKSLAASLIQLQGGVYRIAQETVGRSHEEVVRYLMDPSNRQVLHDLMIGLNYVTKDSAEVAKSGKHLPEEPKAPKSAPKPAPKPGPKPPTKEQ